MTRLSSKWFLYQKLQVKAVSQPISDLCLPQPPPGPPMQLSMDKALLFSSAHLRFHFYYGDFVHWMGGEYTNRHRDWDATFDTIERICTRPPSDDHPPADLLRGKRIATEGVPLCGHFVCPQSKIAERDRYDNHPAVKLNFEQVEAKFAKEEAKAYHIDFLCFLVYFIPGLLLNPFQWAFQKGEGCICIDCTNGPNGAESPGSANKHIPKPSVANADKCTPVYYMSTLMR